MIINRFYLLLLLLVAHSFSMMAQENKRDSNFSGTIIDLSTGEPIVSATVAVWSQSDSTLVSGSISNVDGSFSVSAIPQGRYDIQISFVGYETQRITDLAVGGQAADVDLGTIKMSPDVAMLDGVEVVAERNFVEVGIDRTIYNTKDQIVSAGGSAANVLETIPSVEVDIDGNISLRGNQNVAILIKH